MTSKDIRDGIVNTIIKPSPWGRQNFFSPDQYLSFSSSHILTTYLLITYSTSPSIKMVNIIRASGLLALIPFIAAAPTSVGASLDVRADSQNTELFSFEKWAEEKIANPSGNHLSPDEAVALAFNQTSTGS